jgi:CRP-like cAMP-binding protein
MALDITWLEEKVFQEKIDSADAGLLNKVTDVCQYKKGDVILEQGKPGGALYLVREGAISIHCNGVKLASEGEANLFGEMSFLSGDAVSATVRAESDCTIYMLTRNGYAQVMQENQSLVFALFSYVLKNTARMLRRVNADYTVMQHYISGGRA